MVALVSPLVALLLLIDRLPLPPAVCHRRGHPVVYSDRLVLKAIVVMVLRKTPTVYAFVTMLEQPTAEMQRLRALLSENGRFPSRRTWERRLATLPATLPARIACLGELLLGVLTPWSATPPTVAIDSTLLPARGGVWHRKDREAQRVPHTSIDTEAHWTHSGWHGWVYGWKLHAVTTACSDVWLPLAAAVTPANVADATAAPALLRALPQTVRYLLGDTAYGGAALVHLWARGAPVLVTPPVPRRAAAAAGRAVRHLFHRQRSQAIEPWNGQFKAIFDLTRSVPTRGALATQRYVLGAVFVYQLTLWLRHEQGLPLRAGLKAFLQAA
jgi:Transposase DDE domain